ncbi:type I 3-dehydroquinate dehydratase [Solimonas marina]|uniref:3-dehydroquinate dehydratase n=1 Tax=Solimonas marina TaxID=2714601 RepID=A0A969WAT1_9GAMM|nr:type I 3-dehydroquinate dehydratase [Solimonas marina]NKF23762.1 type I 3-dehydroquinate dehydratase [Solimonas marina]
MNRRELLMASTGLLATNLLSVAQAADADGVESVKPTMRPIKVKDVVIGEGRVKAIVPITGATAEQALAQAKVIGASRDTDVVEFRVDFLDIGLDAERLAALGPKIAAELGGKPMIVTFRTKAEGGKKAISDADYEALYTRLLQAGFADLIDVEMYRDTSVVRRLVAAAHAAGAYVVMSNHDFGGTPPAAELLARLRRQQALGADVLKLAMMPRNPGDVLELLRATWEMSARYAERPMMTMSMGGTGVVSRLAGEIFGSAMCFGMIGHASAPGQVEIDRLVGVLDLIHGSLEGA